MDTENALSNYFPCKIIRFIYKIKKVFDPPDTNDDVIRGTGNCQI